VPFKFSPRSSGLSSKYFWQQQNSKQEKANQQLSANKFYPYAREASASTQLTMARKSIRNSQEDEVSKERRTSKIVEDSDAFPQISNQEETMDGTKAP